MVTALSFHCLTISKQRGQKLLCARRSLFFSDDDVKASALIQAPVTVCPHTLQRLFADPDRRVGKDQIKCPLQFAASVRKDRPRVPDPVAVQIFLGQFQAASVDIRHHDAAFRFRGCKRDPDGSISAAQIKDPSLSGWNGFDKQAAPRIQMLPGKDTGIRLQCQRPSLQVARYHSVCMRRFGILRVIVIRHSSILF